MSTYYDRLIEKRRAALKSTSTERATGLIVRPHVGDDDYHEPLLLGEFMATRSMANDRRGGYTWYVVGCNNPACSAVAFVRFDVMATYLRPLFSGAS